MGWIARARADLYGPALWYQRTSSPRSIRRISRSSSSEGLVRRSASYIRRSCSAMANRVSVPKRTTLCLVSSLSGRDISDRPTSDALPSRLRRPPTPARRKCSASSLARLVWRAAWTLSRLNARFTAGLTRRRLRAGDHKASKPGGQMSAGRILSAGVVALGLFGSFLPAYAELYPTRPIKVIVPTPAGGPVDVVARLVGNYLAAAFGQAVVVDNRPGAGNTIGSKEAAQAEPDGYTLLYSSASGLVLAPMLQKNAGYDPLTSYDPIALVAQSSNILVVHPSVPVGSVQELVAYAKANP